MAKPMSYPTSSNEITISVDANKFLSFGYLDLWKNFLRGCQLRNSTSVQHSMKTSFLSLIRSQIHVQ